LASLLYDNHGRTINYVRLAVTDRCNLRCYYCMPEEGIEYVPRTALMSYEEMVRMMQIMGGMGIQKVRITGGEPFVRRDLMDFIRTLADIDGIKEIALTTNGTLTAPHIPELKKLGIKTINLSLDSLDRARFFEITRRDEFEQVWKTFQLMLEHGIKVKLNSVVTEGKNEDDLLPMVELTKNHPISVRFIEEMPFNGEGNHHERLHWDWKRIHDLIKSKYPTLYKLPDPPNSTAYHYGIPGHQGNIGIIAAYSRTFCGTCNRIRITPQGGLKTCLYDEGVFNIKDLMRAGASNEEVKVALLEALGNRAKDGHEAEARRFFAGTGVHESMTTIGG
jgi:molybdenum cofactor biosynthesis protein A